MQASTSGLENAGGDAAPGRFQAGARTPRVLKEDLFWGALFRERKRADRSNHPLALLIVGPRDARRPDAGSLWRAISRALIAVKRETDLVGWFEQGDALGLMLTDIPAEDTTFVQKMDEHIREQLRCRLPANALDRLSIRMHVHPDPAAVRCGLPTVDSLMSDAVPAMGRGHAIAKRALDLFGSLALLLGLSPVFLAVAALVKLTSRGPVFFRQVRIGEKGMPFQMLKFRTMRPDANQAVHQDYVTWFIKASADAKSSGAEPLFKIANDPRVTPVGRFLRRTSLDELPQLWNVVRGEMSLVGPRPPLPYEVDQYKSWHRRRVLEARPGITGLWQVTGRSRTTFDEMVRLDLRYAKTRSFWLDVKILLATPRAVISGKGAC